MLTIAPERVDMSRAARDIGAGQSPLTRRPDVPGRYSPTGIYGETMAGKGSLRYDNPLCMGAIGATGTFAANDIALKADLVIGIGTRYSDFTTASKTQFQDPGVTFVNINVAEFDAAKHSGLMLVGAAGCRGRMV